MKRLTRVMLSVFSRKTVVTLAHCPMFTFRVAQLHVPRTLVIMNTDQDLMCPIIFGSLFVFLNVPDGEF